MTRAQGATDALAVTTAARVAVAAQLRVRNLPPRVRERLEMVKATALGQDVAAIARWSGRSPRRVRHWLRRFLAGGMEALTDAPRSGRPPKADAADVQALETATDVAPPTLGLPFDVWTSARLSAYLAETTGVRVAPGWVRALLARQRLACGRPQHTLPHLQDPQEVAAWEAELAVAGDKGGRGAGAV